MKTIDDSILFIFEEKKATMVEVQVAENNELHPRERQICIDRGSGRLY